MGRKAIDITGQRFGSLVALARAGTDSAGKPIWKCICDCGTLHHTLGQTLRKGECTRCSACLAAGRAPSEVPSLLIECWFWAAGEDGGFVVAKDLDSGRIVTHSAWSRTALKGAHWRYGQLKVVLDKLQALGLMKPRNKNWSIEQWCTRSGVAVKSHLFTPRPRLAEEWAKAQASGTGPKTIEVDRGNGDRRRYAVAPEE